MAKASDETAANAERLKAEADRLAGQAADKVKLAALLKANAEVQKASGN